MAPSEQALIRQEARKALVAQGIPTYPSVNLSLSHHSQDIHRHFEGNPEAFQSVCLAGRMMSRRVMGGASFVELQDAKGRIQVYIRRSSLCPSGDTSLYDEVFKKRMDIGDIFCAEGFVFKTQKGEITLHARSLRLLAKALRPLPIVKEREEAGEKQVYDAFTDPETRYRQRYVDLIVNPSAGEVFLKRARMIQHLRTLLNEEGYMEVETPILQAVHGGASARPFVTHHNTLNTDFFMRVAKELHLKRLVVGGLEGVYELGKDFRNEGMSRFHNPEFTQLELYVAYKDYQWMAGFVEKLLSQVVVALHGSHTLRVAGHTLDFTPPWQRVCFYEALTNKTGKDLRGVDTKTLCATAETHGLSLTGAEKNSEAKLLDHLFGALCEKTFRQPTIVMDPPLCLSPLAKEHAGMAGIAERFEVICNGKELCNAYSELNDPMEQRLRFEEQQRQREGGDEEAMGLDKDFLRALEYGMPPTTGLGVGIDRLAMLMCDAASIQDVIFFPQMRPEVFSSSRAVAGASPTLEPKP